MANFDAKAYLSQVLGEARSLREFEKLMEVLGRPQDDYRVMHVAGTNGKGSTCAFLSNILQENGYKTGMFISPALLHVNERMQIDRLRISDDELTVIAEMVCKAEQKIGVSFGGFYRMTATALLWFSRSQVDFAVIEAGIGGLMDCTNVCYSEIAMITAVGMDHTNVLGNTLEAIAKQKAGIIKPGQRCVVLHPQEPMVELVVAERCEELGIPLLRVDDCNRKVNEIDDFTQYCQIIFPNGTIIHPEIQIIGEHQLDNACAALLAAQALGLSKEASLEAVAMTTWPGRMELLHGDPPVLLDGAHNPQAMKTLIQGVRRYFNDYYVIAIVTMMEDKNCMEMVDQLSELVEKAIVVAPLTERMIDPEQLMARFQRNEIAVSYSKSFQNGFVDALRFIDGYSSEKQALVLVTGSLFLVGSFRSFLLSPNHDNT